MTNETTNNEPKVIAREDVPERPEVATIATVLVGIVLVALTGPFGGGFTITHHWIRYKNQKEWDAKYGHAFEEDKKVEVV